MSNLFNISPSNLDSNFICLHITFKDMHTIQCLNRFRRQDTLLALDIIEISRYYFYVGYNNCLGAAIFTELYFSPSRSYNYHLVMLFPAEESILGIGNDFLNKLDAWAINFSDITISYLHLNLFAICTQFLMIDPRPLHWGCFSYFLKKSTNLIATLDDKELIIVRVNFENLRRLEYVADEKSSFSSDLFQTIRSASYLSFLGLALFRQYKFDFSPGISYDLLLALPQETPCIGLGIALLNSSLTLDQTDFTIMYLEEDIDIVCDSFLKVDANPISMGVFQQYFGSFNNGQPQNEE